MNTIEQIPAQVLVRRCAGREIEGAQARKCNRCSSQITQSCHCPRHRKAYNLREKVDSIVRKSKVSNFLQHRMTNKQTRE